MQYSFQYSVLRLTTFCITIIFSSLQGSMNFIITRAQAYHNPADIASVINKAYAKVPYIKEGQHRTTCYEIMHIIMNTRKNLYLCFDRERLCGTVLLDATQEKSVGSLFAIDPAYQGKSAGIALLRHVEQELCTLGKDQLYINVIPLFQERLVAYYQCHGFVATGETKPLSEETLKTHIKPEYWKTIYYQVMCKKLKSTCPV